MMTDQKTVFITGASSDIGQATCQKFLNADYKVIAHYRTMRPKFATLIASSDDIEAYQFDFSNIDEFESTLKSNRAFFDRVDILVNLAADLPAGTFAEADAEKMMSAFRINVLPGLLLMQVMGPAMAKRGWGRIVHASSIGVKFGGGRNSFVYSLSKHALEFIPSVCKDWAGDGVLSNVVRLGVTDTASHQSIPDKNLTDRARLIPVARVATPDEMAKTLYWLASAENTYTTGQVIAVSGGE